MTDEQFAQAAEQYMDTIFRVAYGYLRSQSDADDVTQDVLIQLYKTDTPFHDSEHLKRWLIRVTVNRARTSSVPRGTGWRILPTMKTPCNSTPRSAGSCSTR